MNQKKIGNFFKELRKEKGVTQEQLSEYLGVTNRTISRWENGVNMPDFDLIIKIAQYFDVTIEELLDGERKTNIMHKETEDALLKVADYHNNERMIYSKRQCFIFVLGLFALIVYMIIEAEGLTSIPIYDKIASSALGLVFGTLLMGILYTSQNINKLYNFKMLLLHRKKRG